MVYVTRKYPWIMLENVDSILYSINVETWEIRNDITHRIINGSFSKSQGKIFKLDCRGVYPLKKLIAMQFVENPNNYKYVIFKDGNYYNYSLDNIAWSEKKQNIKRK